jgi:hypothetical protein
MENRHYFHLFKDSVNTNMIRDGETKQTLSP